MRAIRGAITVAENTVEAIEDATAEMLREIERRNVITASEVVSAFFSLTPDLDATFPARAARLTGWHDVAMLDTVEVNVPGAMQRTIRVLLHADIDRAPKHAYLRDARRLRPEFAEDV